MQISGNIIFIRNNVTFRCYYKSLHCYSVPIFKLLRVVIEFFHLIRTPRTASRFPSHRSRDPKLSTGNVTTTVEIVVFRRSSLLHPRRLSVNQGSLWKEHNQTQHRPNSSRSRVHRVLPWNRVVVLAHTYVPSASVRGTFLRQQVDLAGGKPTTRGIGQPRCTLVIVFKCGTNIDQRLEGTNEKEEARENNEPWKAIGRSHHRIRISATSPWIREQRNRRLSTPALFLLQLRCISDTMRCRLSRRRLADHYVNVSVVTPISVGWWGIFILTLCTEHLSRYVKCKFCSKQERDKNLKNELIISQETKAITVNAGY